MPLTPSSPPFSLEPGPYFLGLSSLRAGVGEAPVGSQLSALTCAEDQIYNTKYCSGKLKLLIERVHKTEANSAVSTKNKSIFSVNKNRIQYIL